MPARECAETRAGLALIAKGVSVRAAAKAVGVAPSTLTRALKRREPGTASPTGCKAPISAGGC